MIKGFFLFCLCLVAGAFFYQKISTGSGYVLISLGSTSVEMSFWTGVFLLLAGFLVSLLLFLLARFVFRVVTTGTVSIAKMKIFRGSDKSNQRQIARGLIEFMEGNWKQARKRLLASAKKAEFPMINFLAAARSTYELGNEEEALELLHKAEISSSDSGLAVALTQARMLLAKQKYEQCLANLERAKKIAPRHPVVLDLLQKTYMHLQDWKSLKSLIPELRKYNVITAEELIHLEETLYGDLLQQAGEKGLRQTADEAAATLASEWNSFPIHIRKQIEILEVYIQLLINTQNQNKAEHFLRREINRNWHDRLVILYGRIQGRDAKKQWLVAEGWLKARPGNAALLLTLGRLCLLNEHWPEARSYFEDSLTLNNDPEAYAELARLLAHLGDYKLSTECYQKGLLMTTAALPQLPMPTELISDEKSTLDKDKKEEGPDKESLPRKFFKGLS